MFSKDFSKVECVEITINVLVQALQQLHEHDYVSAQVMLAIAMQTLEDLQLDFERHLQVEGRLNLLLKQSLR